MICGVFGELTFEHIPPQSAFNSSPIRLHSLAYISDASYQIAKKLPTRKHNRGLGEHTICGRCNHFTGHQYVPAYLGFALEAMKYVELAGKEQNLYLPFFIRPLNILKQIATMALSLSIAGGNGNPELARFVLNPRSRSFPKPYECYVYLVQLDSEARYCTESVTMNTGRGTMDHVLAEVALPPMGFVVTHVSADRPSDINSDHLCPINHFTRFDLDELALVHLRIPLHYIWSPTILDYRKAA